MYRSDSPMYRQVGCYSKYYEERERCEHRTISLFCAIQCWVKGWDGIRISRDQLKQLLAIKKLVRSRVELIKQDFQELFPYRHEYRPFSFEFSRRDFDEQPVINDCIIPERPISDNKFGLLDELFLPTFNEAILDIFIHKITH